MISRLHCSWKVVVSGDSEQPGRQRDQKKALLSQECEAEGHPASLMSRSPIQV